jgi:hypothetical protein
VRIRGVHDLGGSVTLGVEHAPIMLRAVDQVASSLEPQPPCASHSGSDRGLRLLAGLGQVRAVSAKLGGKERCESGRIGLTANELTG